MSTVYNVDMSAVKPTLDCRGLVLSVPPADLTLTIKRTSGDSSPFSVIVPDLPGLSHWGGRGISPANKWRTLRDQYSDAFVVQPSKPIVRLLVEGYSPIGAGQYPRVQVWGSPYGFGKTYVDSAAEPWYPGSDDPHRQFIAFYPSGPPEGVHHARLYGDWDADIYCPGMCNFIWGNFQVEV